MIAGSPGFGEWQELGLGDGHWLAIDGPYTAAAGLGSVTVWDTTSVVVTAPALQPAPGHPRFVRDGATLRVHWGAVVLDVGTGQVADKAGLLTALGDEVERPMWPGHTASDRRVTSCAWSPDGDAILVATQDTAATQSATASASLFDRSGRLLSSLWQGNDLSPVAVWCGRRFAMVGTRWPQVFTNQGRPIAQLDGTTPPVRLEATSAETRVLVVENHRLGLWEISSGSMVASLDGLWLDASIAPAGGVVVAVDFDRSLSVMTETLEDVIPLQAPGPVDGVALGDSRIAVATSGRAYSAPILD